MQFPATMDLAHLALAVIAAIAIGLRFVARKEIVNELAIEARQDAADAATYEQDLGLSDVMIAPLKYLGVGDLARFGGALLAKIKYLRSEQNRTTEAVTVFRKQYTTNPTFAKAFDQLYADLKAGAPLPQLIQDGLGVSQALPQPPQLRIAGQVSSSIDQVEKAFDALANNPQIAPLVHTLQNAGMGDMVGVVTKAIDAHASVVSAAPAPAQPSGPAPADPTAKS